MADDHCLRYALAVHSASHGRNDHVTDEGRKWVLRNALLAYSELCVPGGLFTNAGRTYDTNLYLRRTFKN